LNILVINLSN